MLLFENHHESKASQQAVKTSIVLAGTKRWQKGPQLSSPFYF